MISARAAAASRERDAPMPAARVAIVSSRICSSWARAGSVLAARVNCSAALFQSPMRTKSVRTPMDHSAGPRKYRIARRPWSRTPPAGSRLTRSTPAHAYQVLALASVR